MIKNLPAVQELQEMRLRSLSQGDPLEEEMATHSSILAWEIPRTEKPTGLQSRGLSRVGHDERLCVHEKWDHIKMRI